MDDTGAAPVVIFGGRSQIGGELARRLAAGATMVLAARNADQLADQAAALRAAGAIAVHTREFDADDLAAHGPLVASLVAEHGPIGTAVLAFGILGDQARAETDAAHAVAIVHTDYVAQVSLLTHLAAAMRTAGRGSLVVFSSVAGIRVRRANYSLRIGQSRPGRLRQRPGRCVARHRGAVTDRAAGIRHRAHDRGHDARTPVGHPGAGGRRDRACAGQR